MKVKLTARNAKQYYGTRKDKVINAFQSNTLSGYKLSQVGDDYFIEVDDKVMDTPMDTAQQAVPKEQSELEKATEATKIAEQRKLESEHLLNIKLNENNIKTVDDIKVLEVSINKRNNELITKEMDYNNRKLQLDTDIKVVEEREKSVQDRLDQWDAEEMKHESDMDRLTKLVDKKKNEYDALIKESNEVMQPMIVSFKKWMDRANNTAQQAYNAGQHSSGKTQDTYYARANYAWNVGETLKTYVDKLKKWVGI